MNDNQVTFKGTPTFKHHTDPGHGWIEVPKDLALALGFTKEISSYSFHDQDNYYLEEDCDVELLIAALKNLGHEEFQFDEHHDCRNPNSDSFVRSLASVGR